MKKIALADPRTSAADALAAVMPSTAPLTATANDSHSAEGMASAVVATFVGETSADLALVLLDAESIVSAAAGTDSALVSIVDVLRPALEAAVSQLGTGVLGPASVDDASALFADEDSQVFSLESGGVAAGWFAIRLRQNHQSGSIATANGALLGKLGRINNVEMSLTVEIGRTRMSVRDVLGLEPGAVIELDRSAGAPADVLLNGRLIAHGEIVVVDQDYAVRITKILDVAEGLL